MQLYKIVSLIQQDLYHLLVLQPILLRKEKKGDPGVPGAPGPVGMWSTQLEFV